MPNLAARRVFPNEHGIFRFPKHQYKRLRNHRSPPRSPSTRPGPRAQTTATFPAIEGRAAQVETGRRWVRDVCSIGNRSSPSSVERTTQNRQAGRLVLAAFSVPRVPLVFPMPPASPGQPYAPPLRAAPFICPLVAALRLSSRPAHPIFFVPQRLLYMTFTHCIAVLLLLPIPCCSRPLQASPALPEMIERSQQ